VPICPTLSSILALPKYVALHFWKLMLCLEQFPLHACSRLCICPCCLNSEPRMDSRMISISISGTCLRTLRKDLLNLCLSESTLPHTSKIETRPPSHNPYLQPCNPHPLSMFRLYTAFYQSVYSRPGS